MMNRRVVWLLLPVMVALLSGLGQALLPRTIPVGAMFAPDQHQERSVFEAAVRHFSSVLEDRHQSRYLPEVRVVDAENSYLVYREACRLLRAGPVAIFGPFADLGAMQLQPISENYEIPHIEARLQTDEDARRSLSVNLYPHQSTLARVFLDLIDALQWHKLVIVYEDSDSIIHFSEYLQHAQETSWEVRLFQLQPDQPYRDILWQVKATGVDNIVLDVATGHILEVMKQAQQVGLLHERHKYLVTSLDLHTLDLEAYRHSRANITSLRMVQDEHPHLENLNLERPEELKSISAMIYDGMDILTTALLDVGELQAPGQDVLRCSNQSSWPYGSTVLNYVRSVVTEGITGRVGFDRKTGFRANLTYDVVAITETGFEQIGRWQNGHVRKTARWFRHLPSRENVPVVKVTTVLNDPFVMNARSSKELRGNDRYEGFVCDMMVEISKLLNVRFEINLVKDGAYGAAINVTANEWNGMIGEVLRGEADIAVADLTINSNREQAVDFTYPFMSTGISILYKKPTTKQTSLWSFLSPFSTVVWIALLGAIVGISLIFFYVGRFTPYEWYNPHPCQHHEPRLENACNMRNSFWCIIGSLMQQGSDVAPKALSTRVISAIWYFFTLIIVSSYTANLAAFLTVEKVPFPFENVEQLAQQTKIKYGCLRNGATHKFFANSQIPLYKQMSRFMEEHANEVLMPSNAAGREKVEKENGKYAFFMESATIEYITERYCNLTQVGGLLDSKGYGVATRKGAKIRASLSEAILKLQETGVLQQLKDRWWKQKGGGQCVAPPSTPLTELGLKNLGGVFVVLVVGSLFALMLGIVEFLFKTRMSTLDSSTYLDDLMQEFKFVVSCQKSTKVLKRRSMKSLSATPAANHRHQLLSQSNVSMTTTNGGARQTPVSRRGLVTSPDNFL